jgi:hypothetical protein
MKIEQYKKEELSKFENKAIVSEYIVDTALWNGRKMHLRLFLLICSATKSASYLDNIQQPVKFIITDFGWIRTAYEPYQKSDWINPRIHDTHGKSTDRNILFPDEMDKSWFNDAIYTRIKQQLRELENKFYEKHADKIKSYEESSAGFFFLGIDVMLERDEKSPDLYNIVLLECNKNRGMNPIKIADENYEIFNRRFNQWLYDNAIKPIFS